MMRASLVQIAFLLLLPLLGACGEADNGDYVTMTGGGFQFNYRISEVTYTMVARGRRTVPEGTVFIAEFEDPAGGPPKRAELISQNRQTRFALTSPPVKDVIADTEYKVKLRLETPDGEVLEVHEKTYKSKIGSSILADKPLTIGPGYTKNPDADKTSNSKPE